MKDSLTPYSTCIRVNFLYNILRAETKLDNFRNNMNFFSGSNY